MPRRKNDYYHAKTCIFACKNVPFRMQKRAFSHSLILKHKQSDDKTPSVTVFSADSSIKQKVLNTRDLSWARFEKAWSFSVLHSHLNEFSLEIFKKQIALTVPELVFNFSANKKLQVEWMKYSLDEVGNQFTGNFL